MEFNIIEVYRILEFIYSLMFLIEQIQVWRFFVTFGDAIGLPSFTLDEFVQALHDYVSSRYKISY